MKESKITCEKPVINFLNDQKEKNELLCLLLLFFLSIIVRYYMADFVKAIETYPDELLYYNVARSIYQGDGFQVRCVATSFQKVLYPLFLAPVFSINDSILRIKAINLFNCLLMSSSFFPAWLIDRECAISRNNRIWLLVILFFWPDFLLTMTFMSEALYWPLFLWATYFLVLNYRKQSCIIAIVGGLVCYLGYMCKEIFLVLVLTHIICESIWPVIYCRMNRCSFKSSWQSYKKDLALVGVFSMTFLLCHILIITFLFYGLGNSYNRQMELDAILSPSKFKYLMYGFIYFISAELLVCMFLPIIMPVVCWKGLSNDKRKFCFLVFMLLLISAIVISYTITVREDFGKLVPRVHLRYVGPAVVLSYICMFTSLKNYELSKQFNENRFMFIILSLITTLLVVVTFKGITPGSAVDQFSGMWYLALQQRVGVLNINQDENIPILLYAVFAGLLLLCLCGANIYLFYRKKKNSLKHLFILIIILTSFVSTVKGYEFARNAYKADNKAIDVVDRIEEYFLSLGKNKVKVFIVDNPGWQSAKYIDTFFDTMTGTYIIEKQDIKSMMMLGKSFNVSDLAMYEPVWRSPYTKTDHIDYFIIQEGIEIPFLYLNNLELIQDISQGGFLVYKNLNPKSIELKKRSNFQIDFSGNSYNAANYVLSGISVKENGFSWTDGNILKVRVPTYDSEDEIYRTKINFIGTFNGKKRLVVIDNHEKELLCKDFEGKGDVEFAIRSEKGFINFAVVFPDAQYVNRVNPQSSDHRKVAFQLESISFQEIKH